MTFSGRRGCWGQKKGAEEAAVLLEEERGRRLNFGPTAFPGGRLSVRESTREQVKTVSDLQTSLTILTSPA